MSKLRDSQSSGHGRGQGVTRRINSQQGSDDESKKPRTRKGSSNNGPSTAASTKGEHRGQAKPSLKYNGLLAQKQRRSPFPLSSSDLEQSFGSDASNVPSTTSSSQDWRDPTLEGSVSYSKRMSDYYQMLKRNRERERKDAIKNGFLADPERPTSLAEAITPVGTCQDMCPEFERVERIVQLMVDGCEKTISQTSNAKIPCEERMVKRFRRSAAGYDEQLPSDIRPPLVLQKSLNYLFDQVIGRSQQLASVHKFVWDRTRGIRNDFSIQQVTKLDDIRVAIDCFERVARFHILSLHQLSSSTVDNSDFDHHQEREQLNNTLLSLMYYYDDSRHKFTSPNEAEFRAYCIIFEIQDQRPDMEDRAQNWPRKLLEDPRIQVSLQLYAAAGNTTDEQGPLRPRTAFSVAQSYYSRFWTIISSSAVSYLMACAAEIYFHLVRKTALDIIWKAYKRGTSTKTEDLIISDLATTLGFDTEAQAQAFCEDHGFTVRDRGDGQAYVDLTSVTGRYLSDSNPRRKQMFSIHLVERKRLGRTLSAVINGINASKAQLDGFCEQELNTERSLSLGASNKQSLFLTENSAVEKASQPAEKGPINREKAAFPTLLPVSSSTQSLIPQSTTSHNPFAPKINPTFATTMTSTNSMLPLATTFGKPTILAVSSDNIESQSVDGHISSSSTSAGKIFKSVTKSPSKSVFSTLQTSAETQPQDITFTTPRSLSQSHSVFAATPSTHNLNVDPPTVSRNAVWSNNHTIIPRVKPSPENSVEINNQDQPRNSHLPAVPFVFSKETLESSLQQPRSPTSSSMSTPGPLVPLVAKPFTGTISVENTTPSAEHETHDVSPQSPRLSLSIGSPSLDASAYAKMSPLMRAATLQVPNALDLHDKSGSPRNQTSSTPFSSPRPESPIQKSALSSEHLSFSSPPFVTLPRSKEELRSVALDMLSRSFMLGEEGLLKQFVEFTVGPIVATSLNQIECRRSRAEERKIRREMLERKYMKKWKYAAWKLSLLKKGKDSRRHLAQSIEGLSRNAYHKSGSGLIIKKVHSSREDYKDHRINKAASDQSMQPHANSPQWSHRPKALGGGSIQEHMTDPDNTVNELKCAQDLQISPAWHSSHGGLPSQKLSSLQEAAIPSRSSKLLLPNVPFPSAAFQTSNKSSMRKEVKSTDTTRTAYFRLKALGLNPDTPNIPITGKRRHRYGHEGGGKRLMMSLLKTTEPPHPEDSQHSVLGTGLHHRHDRNQEQRFTSLNDEDEDILAQMRKVREAISESIDWFREERARSELSQDSVEDSTEIAKEMHLQEWRPTPSRTEQRHAASQPNSRFLSELLNAKSFRHSVRDHKITMDKAKPQSLIPMVGNFRRENDARSLQCGESQMGSSAEDAIEL